MLSGLVAIVGRPNVGKSTLFNQLTRSKTAIVSPEPGVTRDRLYGKMTYSDAQSLIIIDTGGFEKKMLLAKDDPMSFAPYAGQIWEQTKLAIQEADLVLFLLDGKTGVQPHDLEITHFLRAQKKKILLLINKVDSEKDQSLLWEFASLGIPDYIPISAAHNRGLGELKELIREELSDVAMLPAITEEGTKLALVGRPNVGKSSILNRLVGESRCLVTPVAGTTRDSVHTQFQYNKKPYVLIDTAGIRRKTRISEFVEEQSVVRSLGAIQKADIVLHVIDAVQGLTDQDTRLINLAVERGKAVLIIVNKWDLVPDKETKTMTHYKENIAKQLGDHAYLPVHFVSCLTNQRVHGILEKVEELVGQFTKRVNKEELNLALEKIIAAHSPHLKGVVHHEPRFHDAVQAKGTPPTLVIRCNCAKSVMPAYRRYLCHRLRKDLGFNSIPLRLVLRGRRKEHSELL